YVTFYSGSLSGHVVSLLACLTTGRFPYTTLFRSSTPTRPSIPTPSIRGTASASRARSACGCTPSTPSTPPTTPTGPSPRCRPPRSEEHTSELQSREKLVCRLLLEKKNQPIHTT